MAKLNLLFLFCLLFAACSSDDKDNQPILVTNVEMPAQGTVFNPGDKVTISAKGFQADDEIMFSIRWPLADQPIKEGHAAGVYGVITELTATKVTFLAPGHWPASTTEVLLRRSGEMMSLGKISVADGQSPEDFQLYGIKNSQSGENTNYAIDHIKINQGSVEDVNRLIVDQDFSCVVNLPGSGRLCGLLNKDNRRTVGIYDLSMNYWVEQNTTSTDAMGTAADNSVLTAWQHADRLYINKVQTMPFSRMSMPEDPGFKMPAGLVATSLSRYPFIGTSDRYFLFSADNGDGTFSPVVLNGNTNKENCIHIGTPILADALIPFWIVKPVEGNETTKYTRIGGYIVSKKPTFAGEDRTKLQLWNSETKTLEDPIVTFSNTACSVATLVSEDCKTQKLYILFDAHRNGKLIKVYDWLKKDWSPTNLSGFVHSEIVLAR